MKLMTCNALHYLSEPTINFFMMEVCVYVPQLIFMKSILYLCNMELMFLNDMIVNEFEKRFRMVGP
jgi:hypothetical protein